MTDGRSNGTSAIVLRPGSTNELSNAVRDAARARQSIGIRAGGTHQIFGNAAVESDLIADMTGLDAVIEYSPVDLTLAVEPGARLAAIDRMLAEHGQRLVLDMPNRQVATIGGTFAAGLSGPRRLRYGSLKDMVIGLEVVNCHGEITKSGGMVVKNVSGYEVARLHYGAHGAFGIVARLNLKVLPATEARYESLIGFTESSHAVAAGSGVLVSRLDPTAVYLTRDAPGHWTLHVQIEGADGFARAQCERVIDSIGIDAAPASTDVVRVDGDSVPAFDRMVDLQPEEVFVARISTPASKQPAILEGLSKLDGVQILADLGSGLIYLRGGDSQRNVARLNALDAPTAFLSLPAIAKQGLDVFGPMDANGAKIVALLKDQYDPNRMFNPGRFAAFL